MKEVFVHSILDSISVLIFVFIFNIALSFFEEKLSNLLSKGKNVSPFVGSSLGLIPQCGVSVVSADLYIKNKITIGTIIAVFIASSDEAIPIILSNPANIFDVIVLLLIKFVLGFSVGFTVDFILNKKISLNNNEVSDIHIGCCGHTIDNHEENKLHKHIIHPLIHAVKIFTYVVVVNLIFGTLIHYIGIDSISNFLEKNKYITPLFASIIGLIPNCASSVLIANMFILGQLSFGSLTAGLVANSGLGLVVLLKNKNMIKKTLKIICIIILTAIISGYIISFISGF